MTPAVSDRCEYRCLVDEFANILSHDEVEMKITTQERSYTKTTVTSEAISSLLGIYLVTSGCPVMDKLRPLVRFHLPAARGDGGRAGSPEKFDCRDEQSQAEVRIGQMRSVPMAARRPS